MGSRSRPSSGKAADLHTGREFLIKSWPGSIPFYVDTGRIIYLLRGFYGSAGLIPFYIDTGNLKDMTRGFYGSAGLIPFHTDTENCQIYAERLSDPKAGLEAALTDDLPALRLLDKLLVRNRSVRAQDANQAAADAQPLRDGARIDLGCIKYTNSSEL